MIRYLQTKWAAIALGMLTYSLTTWFCLQPQKQLLRAAAAQRLAHSIEPGNSGPSWTFYNPELSQSLAELKDQREALRVRAKQLDELEARLKAEHQEIYSVTQTVYRLRAELETTVTRVRQEELANLKRLAKVYAAMTPEGAARILREMEDEQIVKILTQMKESESAPILENLGGKDAPKRAAILSNRIRLTIPDSKTGQTP